MFLDYLKTKFLLEIRQYVQKNHIYFFKKKNKFKKVFRILKY